MSGEYAPQVPLDLPTPSLHADNSLSRVPENGSATDSLQDTKNSVLNSKVCSVDVMSTVSKAG